MRIKFGDILLSLVIAALAVLLVLAVRPSDAQSLTAVIMQDNEEIQRVDISDSSYNQIINIEQAGIEIAVEEGRIRFVHSSCTDKTCVNTGWLDSPGDMAVCLPNKVLIKIVGDTKPSDIDIIAE